MADISRQVYECTRSDRAAQRYPPAGSRACGHPEPQVNGEKVEGWMDTITMEYPVDDPAFLTRVKPGDRIQATVYAGDMKLYRVQVFPKGPGGSPPRP